MLIFEQSASTRTSNAQVRRTDEAITDIPATFLRESSLGLPECSELQVVRHYTSLSKQNFSIDTNFYPLGSCTMKYNPRGVHKAASDSNFLNCHPLNEHSQGFLSCMHELQSYLADITGMKSVSLTPMAGSQGELAGVMMIRAFHRAKGQLERNEILVPDAAHGTNPASAVMCGFKVREIPTAASGDIDLQALKEALGPQTAGIMLTNPSTLGVFDSQIKDVADLVHKAGGLLYYDGANLNAILGKVKPGDMGFDVMHLNLHKTFATPHGGGGPGAGPVAVSERLVPYIPGPTVIREGDKYRYSTSIDAPHSIGRLSAFMGNAGILLRAYLYIRLLGKDGLRRVSEFATLNANYVMSRLKDAGFQLAYPRRRASHEFIISLQDLKKETGVSAMDFAKRLLDYGFHAPTTYFPLLVPECLLIEPTETESKEELDRFVSAMCAILKEAKETPEKVKGAPWTMPIKRLDDVKAARELDLVFKKEDTDNS